MPPRRTLLAVALALTAACQPRATSTVPATTGSFVERVTPPRGIESYRYQVFVPAGVRPEAGWPVILFLHGAGERGADNRAQLEVGLGPVVRQQADSFPAIVVFPQVPPGMAWAGLPARGALDALEAAMREFGGDPDRVYLTGVSMGGYGSWQIAYERPELFAAVVPVCGGVRRPRPDSWLTVTAVRPGTADTVATVAEQLRAIPSWIWHGDTDPVIPVERSREMHQALQALGAPVRYTELPGVGHNAWDPAYADAELWRWLFAQRRASRP